MISSYCKIMVPYPYLDEDLSYDLPDGGSIQDEIDKQPPVIAADFELTLPGDKSDVSTYNISSPLLFDKITLAQKGVTIKAADGAQSEVLSAAGGGANFVTVLKTGLDGTQAGEWSGAKLSVVSDDAACGDVRTVDGNGAVSSSADGTVPGDGTCWKFTVTSGFSGATDSATKFVLNSVILSSSAGSAVTAYAGLFMLKNLFLDKGILIDGRKTRLWANNCTVGGFEPAGSQIGGVTVLVGELVSTAPFHIIGMSGSSGYGVYVAYGGRVLSLAAQDKVSYISGNASKGLYINNPGAGQVFLKRHTIERNGFGINVCSGNALINTCTFTGSGDELKLRAEYNGVVQDMNNTNNSNETATGGQIY